MKKILLSFVVIFALVVVAGCTAKKVETTEQAKEVEPEEVEMDEGEVIPGDEEDMEINMDEEEEEPSVPSSIKIEDSEGNKVETTPTKTTVEDAEGNKTNINTESGNIEIETPEVGSVKVNQ